MTYLGEESRGAAGEGRQVVGHQVLQHRHKPQPQQQRTYTPPRGNQFTPSPSSLSWPAGRRLTPTSSITYCGSLGDSAVSKAAVSAASAFSGRVVTCKPPWRGQRRQLPISLPHFMEARPADLVNDRLPASRRRGGRAHSLQVPGITAQPDMGMEGCEYDTGKGLRANI